MLCLQRPGVYDVDDWQVLCEVLENDSAASKIIDAKDSERQRYMYNLPVSTIYIEQLHNL